MELGTLEQLEIILDKMTQEGFHILACNISDERGLTLASKVHRNWSAEKLAAMISLLSDSANRVIENLEMGDISTVSISTNKTTLWITEFTVHEKILRLSAIITHGPLRIRSFWERIRQRDFASTILFPTVKKIKLVLDN
jgi:predicted regulator of Ras-like GTPase activity (Roadblock/LC7/MglB family)